MSRFDVFGEEFAAAKRVVQMRDGARKKYAALSRTRTKAYAAQVRDSWLQAAKTYEDEVIDAANAVIARNASAGKAGCV